MCLIANSLKSLKWAFLQGETHISDMNKPVITYHLFNFELNTMFNSVRHRTSRQEHGVVLEVLCFYGKRNIFVHGFWKYDTCALMLQQAPEH